MALEDSQRILGVLNIATVGMIAQTLHVVRD
jgi:hypothetical protein